MIRYLATFVIGLFVTISSYAQESHAPSSMGELKSSFTDAVKKMSPAVVNIFTEKRTSSRAFNPFHDPFFSDFFGGIPSGQKKRVERSLGSGVILTRDGYMVTNYHVIKGADSVKVVLNDRSEMVAKFISADPNTDIAVMKLTPKDGKANFPHVVFADSDKAEVGDIVLAIGNPYGFGQSVSMGIVSAVERSNLGTGRHENYIQTDAAINPGNSGGALIDSLGRLVGITTAIYSKSGGNQGIAFATPGNSIKAILSGILTTGKILRPWIGVGTQEMSAELAKQLGIDRTTGILINEIVPNSPAETAGLEVGDIIMKFDAYDIHAVSQFNARIAASLVNQSYPFILWRGGKTYSSDIFLENIPDRRAEDQYTIRGSGSLGGYTFEKISPALGMELGLPLNSKGVAVVNVPTKNSRVKLRPGDVIVELNNKEVKSIKDLKVASSRSSRAVDIVYKRGSAVHRMSVR